jgi:uncharacterized membrane-anchored protein
MKTIYLLLLLMPFSVFCASKDSFDGENFLKELIKKDQSIKYQTGSVELNSEIELNVPKGYKYMSQKDAEYVVYDFWGNPKSGAVLGMIVKDNFTLLDENAWCFVITYEKSGYVKDEDADKIDYNEMMEEMQSSEKEANEARTKEGYPTIHILNWAVSPFYDKKNNILHWAKSIKFGNNEDTTLNYEVRILGRKGVLNLNAVGVLRQLKDIQQHIPDIIHIAKFKEGSRYIDFDPSVDEVAAYTVGGLVAGKILAKAGIIALLLKNIKIVILAILGFFGAFKNKVLSLFGKGSENNETNTNTEEIVATSTEEKKEETEADASEEKIE